MPSKIPLRSFFGDGPYRALPGNGEALSRAPPGLLVPKFFCPSVFPLPPLSPVPRHAICFPFLPSFLSSTPFHLLQLSSLLPSLYHRGSFAPVCPSVRPSLRIILRALRAGVSLVSSAPFYSLVSSAPFYSSVTLSPDFRSVSSAPIYSPASPAPGSRCVSSAPLPSAEASSSGLLKKEFPPGASLRSIRS